MSAIGAIPLDHAGFVIVGLFLLTWLGAAAYWKWVRSESGPSTTDTVID
jgi:high-affinity nickel permease